MTTFVQSERFKFNSAFPAVVEEVTVIKLLRYVTSSVIRYLVTVLLRLQKQ
jgi:hypothetical protein